MAKKKKEKKLKQEKEVETFSEVFEIEKDGKEKTLVVEGVEEDKPASKSQLKKEKKIFIGVGIIMLILLLMLAGFYWIVTSSKVRNYKGVEFEVQKEGDIFLYKTSIPTVYNGKETRYNFYLRTDPNLLRRVKFNAPNLSIKPIVVINFDENLTCNGYGSIALTNLANQYKVAETKVISDPEASCDPEGRYNYVSIIAGDETKVSVYGINNECFEVQVKDCEVLRATEKLMLENFVEINKRLQE